MSIKITRRHKKDYFSSTNALIFFILHSFYLKFFFLLQTKVPIFLKERLNL